MYKNIILSSVTEYPCNALLVRGISWISFSRNPFDSDPRFVQDLSSAK